MKSVRFIERPEAFALAPALASWVASWQEQCYVIEEHLLTEGDTIYLDTDDDEPSILTAEQARALNAETRDAFTQLRDQFPIPPDKPQTGATIIAEPDCRSMRGIGGVMKRHMTALAAELDVGELIILPDVRASILCQENDHPPVARASAVLEAAGFAKSEDMAAIGPVDAMVEYFGSLFWIARCNASAPYIVVGAPALPLVGELCKHGNVHFTAMDQRRKMIGALKKSGFRLPLDNLCRERFSRHAAISGRRIDI